MSRALNEAGRVLSAISLTDKPIPAPRAPETADRDGNVTERLTLEDNRVALALYGERNANLKLIERETGAAAPQRAATS